MPPGRAPAPAATVARNIIRKRFRRKERVRRREVAAARPERFLDAADRVERAEMLRPVPAVPRAPLMSPRLRGPEAEGP